MRKRQARNGRQVTAYWPQRVPLCRLARLGGKGTTNSDCSMVASGQKGLPRGPHNTTTVLVSGCCLLAPAMRL